MSAQKLAVIIAIMSLQIPCAFSQTESNDALRNGKSFIETKVYSEAQDLALLEKFDGLRVADVSDGMDKAGLPNSGLMEPAIHPLWKDTEAFAHRFIGIAVTARYVPNNRPRPGKSGTEDFDRWVGETYSQLTPEPFTPLLRKGTALVLDDVPGADVGSIGSNNIMAWVSRGCVGVVTNGSTRDSDEVILQKIPLYFRQPGRGIRPGRNLMESVNKPVVCGGVLVMPGDVVVADGDGVIVVPRDVAEEVADYAQEVIEKDKQGRRALYKTLGLPEDDTVR